MGSDEQAPDACSPEARPDDPDTAGGATAGPGDQRRLPAWARAYRQIMQQAGPPVLLIDARGEILHLSAAAGSFLTFNAGGWTSNLLQAVHPTLREPLRAALERASRSQTPQTVVSSAVRLDDRLRSVCLRVSPLGNILPGHLLVAIEAQPLDPSSQATAVSGDEPLRRQLDALEARHTAAARKHQADTEELRTINEELRAATEELEVSKEELQTLNTELLAANHALGDKVNELGQANSDLQNLMAATQIATVFLDRELRITRYTPAAVPIFHLMEGDVGRPLTDLRHGLDHAALKADAVRVLAELKPAEREVGGGGEPWFLMRLTPYLTADHRIAGLVLTCVNVTERKQAEAHRQAKEAAERLNQARGEFLSRVSHELRTPLNAILGFGQLLELGSRDEQDATAVSLILKAGRHLLTLVDEVLDLSRAEGGELRLTFGTVDPGWLVGECVQLVARLAQARQVACAVEGTGEGLPTLWTDEQRLRQVLLNLLTNAIKYNRPGGRVTLRCSRGAEGWCQISVQDTGPGIAPEDLPRLFTPFERLQRHHVEVEGTGLGLAITHRLVGALGGRIGVESTPGQGSRFWVELPPGQTPAGLVRPDHRRQTTIQEPAAGRAVTLLCIEDNASNLELVQAVAARHWPHWRFRSARDASDGLEQARRHHPDLILLDLQLPDHPGDWVLAELRRDPRTARLPVVVLSADATAHSRERLLAGGAAEFVTKPFQIDDLVAAVNRTVRRPPPVRGGHGAASVVVSNHGA